jgi:hypothetical protein
MRQATTLCLWSAIGCAGVAVLTPLLDVVSCLELAVPFRDLVQGHDDTQMISLWSSVEFGKYILHFAL